MKTTIIKEMSDSQLVATMLGRKDTDTECLRIADQLMRNEIGMDGILEDIAQEGGPASKAKLLRVQAHIELNRRAAAISAARTVVNLRDFEAVCELMVPIYAGVQREEFYCLCLNTKNILIKMFKVSIGSLNASIIHPRELFINAIKASAASIIIVHNHPSGDPTPSGADIQVTRRMVKAGDILGIELLDHVVIGGETCASLRELGLM